MAPPGKRRKVEAKQVEEISFDPEARQEYLSGFHKRKLQRAEHGREVAQKKAKEAAVQERKEVRILCANLNSLDMSRLLTLKLADARATQDRL